MTFDNFVSLGRKMSKVVKIDIKLTKEGSRMLSKAFFLCASFDDTDGKNKTSEEIIIERIFLFGLDAICDNIDKANNHAKAVVEVLRDGARFGLNFT
jgi:hypothetical protein